MNVKPREVESGFVLRWLGKSLSIIIRNPIGWFFLISILILSSFLPINLFFKSLVGMFLMIMGIELCILSDNKTLNLKSIYEMIKSSVDGFIFQVYFKIFFLFAIFAVFGMVEYFVPETKDNGFWSSVYWVYGLGLIALMGVGFQIFTHLFSRFFSSKNKREVSYFCKLGSKTNQNVELFFEIFVVVNILIVGYFFPILVLMMFPITCAFVYVGFKEIFLIDDTGSFKKQTKRQISPFEIN